MDANFWLERWVAGQTGFHNEDVNPQLARHFPALTVPIGSHVFVPLCGKTRDIPWLLAKGYQVSGIELSQLAVDQLFEEMDVVPEITEIGALTAYKSEGVVVYVGDFFELTPDVLRAVDLIWDRAALVALPDDMRVNYCSHLRSLTGNAPQLLVTLEYDPAEMDGPPFSITADEVNRHYADHYDIHPLHSAEVADPIKGRVAAMENVWHLSRR
ncbi:MAG: thiopurine S-methyltransferase [Paracoccaceae bacterium]